LCACHFWCDGAIERRADLGYQNTSRLELRLDVGVSNAGTKMTWLEAGTGVECAASPRVAVDFLEEVCRQVESATHSVHVQAHQMSSLTRTIGGFRCQVAHAGYQGGLVCQHRLQPIVLFVFELRRDARLLGQPSGQRNHLGHSSS
jgi:hypothetical protein